MPKPSTLFSVHYNHARCTCVHPHYFVYPLSPRSPNGQLYSILIRKFWKASIRHSFPYSHTHNAISFLWMRFGVLMVVTLKIVLWDVMLYVTLMVGAGTMLLWNTGIVSKKKAIFLQSFNFQILCNIMVSDFMPSISSPMSLWTVTEANGRNWSNVGAYILVTGTLNGLSWTVKRWLNGFWWKCDRLTFIQLGWYLNSEHMIYEKNMSIIWT